jgi:hypothetical protein
MLLNSVILGILIACFLGGLWCILRTPRCRVCKVAMESTGETLSPWGRLGIDAVFYYACPHCLWITRRRHTITHLN